MTGLFRHSPKSITVVAIATTAFVIAYLWSRFWLIESDLAPFDVTQYSPIDAFYYAMMAFDWFQGSTEPAALGNYAPLPSSLFLNAMVYPNLVLARNSFIGMRANVVILSLATALIFSLLLYRRFGIAALLLSLSVYLLSMPWLMASLVVEPTIYRLFHFSILMLMIYVIERKGSLYDPKSIVILFGLAFAGPTFVYPTNLFALAAVMSLYLLESIRLRSWDILLRVALWGAVAGVIVVGLWLLAIYLSVGGIDPVLNYFSMFSTRVAGGASTSLFEQALINFQEIKQFLLFNQVPYTFEAFLAGLVISVVSLTAFTIRAIRGDTTSENARFDRTMLIFLTIFIAQTLFVNDYPVRKLVFLLPFIIFLIPFSISKLVPWSRGRCALLIIATLWLAIPSVQQSQKHLFDQYETTMKQAMMSLQPLGSAQVGGGFSHGFRLYNNIRPFLGYYVYSYVLHDMPTYDAAMANKLEGVTVHYSIQIEVDDTVIDEMAKLGFVLDRIILDSRQRGVGRVALFRWLGP